MDEVIVCSDCRSEFTFTASESSFFAAKGLTKPRRCKACRQKRRDAKAIEGGTAPSPVPVTTVRPTRWVGGGEAVVPTRNKSGKKDRKRDRHDDHNF
jgi:hypothetical protein